MRIVGENAQKKRSEKRKGFEFYGGRVQILTKM